MSGFVPLDFWLAACAALAVAMTVAWIIQLRTNDAGIVDFVWSAGMGLTAIAVALASEGWWARRLLVASMAGAWSFRLAGHILFDRLLRGEEDGRYRALRESLGRRTQLFLFFFFQAQGLLVVLFQLPLVVAMSRAQPRLDSWDAIGVLVFVVALGGEWVADRQLARFRADPGNRGKTCRAGLWRYSRHPNYFFEWIHWWAYVSIGLVAPAGWLTLLGPALMLLFLFKITGIPATEQQAIKSRGDDYREYQRTTSAFFPWPPRGGA
jgi:steroid 5-alpha reductase family enzyme